MKTMLTSLLSALKSNYVMINPLLDGRKKKLICKIMNSVDGFLNI